MFYIISEDRAVLGKYRTREQAITRAEKRSAQFGRFGLKYYVIDEDDNEIHCTIPAMRGAAK